MPIIFNNFALIIAIILSLFILLSKKRKQKYDYEMSNSLHTIILISALFVGIFIRLWQFGIVPAGVNQDGAMAAVDALALAKYGTDRFGTFMPAHLYAWGYGQMSSLLSYLMAILIKVFGFSTTIIRTPQLLVSIAGGIFFYMFMGDTFGKKIGLIAAIFVAINPWHFVQSRWALDCNLLPHFFIAGVYFFGKGLKDKKRNIYISMAFFALCMYCYGITIYTIPVFLVATAIYYYLKKKLTIKDILISIAIYLSISWPFILTIMVNYFKWNTIHLPFITIQYFPDSVRAEDIIFFTSHPLRQLLINISCLEHITIIQSNDAIWNNIPNFGTMYRFTTPFAILGLWMLLKHKYDDNQGLVIFTVLLGIWVGLTTNYVNINRLNIIYYGIMMLSTIGIYEVITSIKHTKWLLIGIYTFAFCAMIVTYFTSYANYISYAFYDGFGDAIHKVESLDVEKLYITADAQGKGYWNVSEILTLFYTQMDAQYFQGKTNINNGKEYLPYYDRYHYLSISENLVAASKDENVAYVITQNDSQYFDDSYEITAYGNYYAVIKK